MKKYNYKDLEAYKEAKILVQMIYSLLQRFPKKETYALCDQLRRAVISIPSNIAEGSGLPIYQEVRARLNIGVPVAV